MSSSFTLKECFSNLNQVTTLIEVTTPSKPSHFLLPSRYDIPRESPYFEETTSPVRSPKSMAFTTNVSESMVMPTSGNTSPIYSITCLLRLLSTIRSSAFMVVSLPPSIPSTTSEPSIAYKRSRTKVQCAICYGPIQMIDVDGAYHQEVLDTLSARTSLKRSTTITA